MITLTALIKYWEEELNDPYGDHYPLPDQNIKATIKYLKKLKEGR